MNGIITYDKEIGFEKNQKLLAPYQEVYIILEQSLHIVQVLKHLVCQKSQIHGWSVIANEIMKIATNQTAWMRQIATWSSTRPPTKAAWENALKMQSGFKTMHSEYNPVAAKSSI